MVQYRIQMDSDIESQLDRQIEYEQIDRKRKMLNLYRIQNTNRFTEQNEQIFKYFMKWIGNIIEYRIKLNSQ